METGHCVRRYYGSPQDRGFVSVAALEVKWSRTGRADRWT